MPSPFYATTPKYLLRKLLGTSNGSDIDAGFDALATDVDNNFTGYKSGTHAARLAATALDGLLWRETDTGLLYLGTGSSTWTPVMFPGGWQALTLGGFVVTGDARTPSARPEGNVVRLMGVLLASGGAPTTWATIPSGLRPSITIRLSAPNSTANTNDAIQIDTAGAMTLKISGAGVWLDGLSFAIS